MGALILNCHSESINTLPLVSFNINFYKIWSQFVFQIVIKSNNCN